MGLLPKHAGVPAQPPRARKRLDFTPSASSGGSFVRFDCVAGRVKVVHNDETLFTRSITLHLNFEAGRSGHLDFNAKGDTAIVSDDRAHPVGDLQWGVEIPIASPYPLTVEGVTIESIPPHRLRTTTRPTLEALGALHEQVERAIDAGQADGPIAVAVVSGWERVAAGAKTFHRPVFSLLGFTTTLDKPLEELLAPEPTRSAKPNGGGGDAANDDIPL